MNVRVFIWIVVSTLFLIQFFLKFTLLENVRCLKKLLLWLMLILSVFLTGISNYSWLQYLFIVAAMFIFYNRNNGKNSRISFQLFMILSALLFCSFINYVQQLVFSDWINKYTTSQSVVTFLYDLILACNILVISLIPRRFYEQLFSILLENDFVKFSFTLLFLTFIFFISITEKKLLVSPIYCSLIIILTITVSFILLLAGFYMRQIKNEKETINRLLHYTKDVEQLYDETTMFRHDYMNILYSLKMAINTKDVELIEEVFNDTIAPTEKILHNDSVLATKLNRIDIPELKSLFYTKLNLAKLKKLAVDINITDKLINLPINKIQLVRLVSILLDNAIEGSELSLDRKLAINIFFKTDICYIEISNSIKENSVDLEKIYLKGFTSKDKTDEHGLGLYYLKNVISSSELLDIDTVLKKDQIIQSLQIQQSNLSIGE